MGHPQSLLAHRVVGELLQLLSSEFLASALRKIPMERRKAGSSALSPRCARLRALGMTNFFGLAMRAGMAGCPIQARVWLEWGSSTAGQSLPDARSRFLAVHSDSISTCPSHPA